MIRRFSRSGVILGVLSVCFMPPSVYTQTTVPSPEVSQQPLMLSPLHTSLACWQLVDGIDQTVADDEPRMIILPATIRLYHVTPPDLGLILAGKSLSSRIRRIMGDSSYSLDSNNEAIAVSGAALNLLCASGNCKYLLCYNRKNLGPAR